ncbi:HD domain-containing phosphohydrolase [Candidatus Auribacterota bacterium]
MKSIEELNRALSQTRQRLNDLENNNMQSELEEKDQKLFNLEETVKIAYAELHQIFNSTEDAMCVINKDYYILRTNEVFLESFCEEENQLLIGQKCHKIIPDQCCHTEKCPLKQISEGADRVTYFITREDKKTKEKKHYEVTAAPFRGFEGELLGIVKDYKDMTEHTLMLEKLRQSSEKLQNSLAGTIKALQVTVDRRDPYTSGHQQRVANLAKCIALEMGLPKKQIDGVFFAGTIHDLGKISVPIEILAKPGKITNDEFNIIKIHPQVGYDILHSVDFPWPIAEAVYQHHEKLDGTGYPQGLTGKDILLEAKILTVADVVEAIATHRPYRPALGIDKAIEIITEGKGTAFDPTVVDKCIILFKEKNFLFVGT